MLYTKLNQTTPKLPYSEHGEFQFCNLNSWEKDDVESIKGFAVTQTEKQGGNVTAEETKTTK